MADQQPTSLEKPETVKVGDRTFTINPGMTMTGIVTREEAKWIITGPPTRKVLGTGNDFDHHRNFGHSLDQIPENDLDKFMLVIHPDKAGKHHVKLVEMGRLPNDLPVEGRRYRSNPRRIYTVGDDGTIDIKHPHKATDDTPVDGYFIEFQGTNGNYEPDSTQDSPTVKKWLQIMFPKEVAITQGDIDRVGVASHNGSGQPEHNITALTALPATLPGLIRGGGHQVT